MKDLLWAIVALLIVVACSGATPEEMASLAAKGYYDHLIHGEYEQFKHVLKNGSGSVRRKIDEEFGNTLSIKDKKSLATLIYYPKEKLDKRRFTRSAVSHDKYEFPFFDVCQ